MACLSLTLTIFLLIPINLFWLNLRKWNADEFVNIWGICTWPFVHGLGPKPCMGRNQLRSEKESTSDCTKWWPCHRKSFNVGVSFLGKWSFISHRNPRNLTWENRRKLLKSADFAVFGDFVDFTDFMGFEIHSFPKSVVFLNLSFLCWNLRFCAEILQWGLCLSSSKVFQTTDKK